MQNFDPFFDYESVREEDAADLQQALIDYYDAAGNLLSASDGRERVVAAASLLKAQRALTDLAYDVHDRIYTVPVMVHVAGEPKEELLHGKESVVQRCSRCGSMLHSWDESHNVMTPKTEDEIDSDGGIEHPSDYFHIEPVAREDVNWWKVGSRIGRGEDDDGEITFYNLKENAELEKHERLCVALNELFGGDTDG